MRVLYLLGQFPAVSETFIAREILALRKLGAHVRIAALEKCRDPLVHDFVRPLAAEALYPTVQTKRLGRMLGRAFCAGTAPRRLLKCRRLSNDAEGRQLLAQAGALAPLVRRLGVDHIHTHFASSNCEMLIYLSGLTDVPFSFTAHAHDIFRRPRLLAEKIAAAKFVLICFFQFFAIELRETIHRSLEQFWMCVRAIVLLIHLWIIQAKVS